MIPSWLSKVVKRTGPARKADHRARARRSSRQSTRLSLESLEDRTLLSWTPIGPAPITNGQIPGRGNVTGRIDAIAGDPTNASTIYVVASGGGVWKTTN